MSEPKEFSPEFIEAVKAGDIHGWTSVTSPDKVSHPAVILVDVGAGQAWELKHSYPTTLPDYVYGKPAPVQITKQ